MNLLALKAGGVQINTPQNLPKAGNEPAIIANAITIFLTAGAIAALIAIIFSGIQLTASNGDSQKIAAARARLTWGIIGLIVMFLSFFIVNVFGGFFGVELLNFAP